MDSKQRRQRIVQARVKLILDHPFFGVLASRFILVEDTHGTMLPIPTMGTDGRRLIFSPEFLDSVTQAELIGLVAHETSHCAFGHPWRLGQREERRANAAMDFAINPILMDAGLALPSGGCYDPQFRGMSFEQIYELLPTMPPLFGGTASGSGGSSGDFTVPPEMVGQVRSPDPKTEHVETLRSDWEVATLQAAQAAKAMGKLPAGLQQLIDDIRHPKVDWKPLLRRFMQRCLSNGYSWVRPHKRYIGVGLYLPTRQSRKMPPIVVATDSSGSCWDPRTQSVFASELAAIIRECKPEKVYAPYCDAKVHEPVRVFEPGQPLTFDVRGGGGTSFVPVFDWIEREQINPACLIYQTDLMGQFPSAAPRYPVLWASTMRGYDVPFGEVIDISE